MYNAGCGHWPLATLGTWAQCHRVSGPSPALPSAQARGKADNIKQNIEYLGWATLGICGHLSYDVTHFLPHLAKFRNDTTWLLQALSYYLKKK